MSCVSAPNQNLSKPAWIYQPARTVDAGYIVYVASALDRSFEQAKFKAKGAAIEDIANECSFPPKGVRVEDEFEMTAGILNEAYIKMTVAFQDCEDAQKALDPTSITTLANVSLANFLKRYQDRIDHESDSAEEQQQHLVKNDEPNSTPHNSTTAQSDQITYLVQRQQVAYAKEVVILAGSEAYPPRVSST